MGKCEGRLVLQRLPYHRPHKVPPAADGRQEVNQAMDHIRQVAEAIGLPLQKVSKRGDTLELLRVLLCQFSPESSRRVRGDPNPQTREDNRWQHMLRGKEHNNMQKGTV